MQYTCQMSNLRCSIHHGMVDHNSLIWIDCILCRFIVCGMVDCTSAIWIVSKWSRIRIFALLSNCMEVSISLSCLFVNNPLYQTVVVCCIICHGSLCMVHCTVFYIRVGLAQARSNKRVAKWQSKENCEINLKVHCVIQLSLSCKAPRGS